MKIGILENNAARELVDDIWETANSKDGRCARCRRTRLRLADKNLYDLDEEKVAFDFDGMKYYSNFLPGFSSAEVDVPLDLLIVLRGHSGDKERRVISAEEKVNNDARYYLTAPFKTSHQHETRLLLEYLNRKGINWICTDYIKCFVLNRRRGEVFEKNEERAQEHCREYLEEQIRRLKPRVVLSCGGSTTKEFFGEAPDKLHGSVMKKKLGGHSYMLVTSYFPKAHEWWSIEEGWKPIRPLIMDNLE